MINGIKLKRFHGDNALESTNIPSYRTYWKEMDGRC